MAKEIVMEEYSKKSFEMLNILKYMMIFLGVLWLITLVIIKFSLANDIVYMVSAGIMLILWLSYNIYEFIKKMK